MFESKVLEQFVLANLGQPEIITSCSLKDIATFIAAIGTLILAVIAIYGDSIKKNFFKPALVLSKHNFTGDLNYHHNTGVPTFYYHLKLVNLKKHSATNVRVLLSEISKKNVNTGKFELVTYIIPMQMTWAFSKFNVLLPTVGSDRYIDLGYINQQTNCFKPSLYAFPGNFQGYVNSGETVRYKIEVVGDNIKKNHTYFVEVFWDGTFIANKNQMQDHIIIKEVKQS